MAKVLTAVLLYVFACLPAWAADAAERRFISPGMTEAQVLLKIGKPDSESIDSGGAALVTVKRWTYMPDSRDPQTVTTVVLRNGKVQSANREVTR